jgi:hypothetical protein
MSLSKLFIAASLLISPVALAKNTPNTAPSTSNVGAPSGGYKGVGSNPKEDSSEKYGNGKGSNQETHHPSDGYTGKGSNPSDTTTYYVPDDHYQDDGYYYNGPSYVPASDISGQKKVSKESYPVAVGLRYSMGKGLDISPELVGGGFYARAFDPSKRCALEVSFDALASDPISGINMRQGNILISYALFLNPEGRLKPYGSIGLGGTWHGVAGNQNLFGALGLGAGLDIALGKSFSLNLDSRLIIDSEADAEGADSGASQVISASVLSDAQDFVISSAGVSIHF